MPYEDFKDLAKRTASDKVLRSKSVNIAKSSKYDAYQRGFASIVYKSFDKETKRSGIKIEIKQNQQQLAEQLHEPIVIKIKKRRVYSLSKDNIWGNDLADMQLISIFNKGNRFLSCVINMYSKYARVAPLKSKKSVTIVTSFKKTLDDSKRKPNKICVDKGR